MTFRSLLEPVVLTLIFSRVFAVKRSSSGELVRDHVLSGHTFSYCNVNSLFSCAHRCLSLAGQCESYSYATAGEHRGLCALNGPGTTPSGSLTYKPGFVFVRVLLRQVHLPHSCVEVWEGGARISGKYRVEPTPDKRGTILDEFCDFISEPGWAWTLVMSQSFANKNQKEFYSTPFEENAPVNESEPNWAAYRLSLDTMTYLKSVSTHWRVTCSFPALGVDGRDYIRANFTEFDPMTFRGNGVCKEVEYIDVRGSSCSQCTSTWWMSPKNRRALHHDSSNNRCELKSSQGRVDSEDNFGSYANPNTDFRCSSGPDATTNHWFGRRV